MMEEIREVKITIYIDTNKTTYEETFSDLENATEYLERILDHIRRME